MNHMNHTDFQCQQYTSLLSLGSKADKLVPIHFKDKILFMNTGRRLFQQQVTILMLLIFLQQSFLQRFLTVRKRNTAEIANRYIRIIIGKLAVKCPAFVQQLLQKEMPLLHDDNRCIHKL